jgi:uncharacterized protein (DUF2147 family)
MKTAAPALALTVLSVFVPAAQAASIDGDWLTPKGGAKVHIANCGPKLCGVITWLKNPNDKTGQPAKDAYNPDPTLKSRPVVGVQILRNMQPAGDGRWTGGSIYNPGDGKTYASKMILDPTGVLKVQGCVSVICVTQVWTRAS